MNNFTQEFSHLTPQKIVDQLNRFIIGQDEAKKAVAIALRNRIRRRMIEDPQLQEEIVPKNILMIGPTGVGKTEIARRLAKIVGAPFVKTEATKFTEVGYVGKDVDSIVRDLLENAISLVKKQMHERVKEQAEIAAEEKILDALVGTNSNETTREKFRDLLKQGKLEDKEIEIEVLDQPANSGNPMFDVPGMPGAQMGIVNVGEMFQKALGMDKKTKPKKMSVKHALDILIKEESEKLIDQEKVIRTSIELTEQDGIVFIDEIDKVVTSHERRGADASREGVQRDLLPLIEGTYINTKYGTIKTDHILFIASGAFHLSKPSDLLPELQGRLPIRVELKSLTKEDMIRILKETESSLLKQYQALLGTEHVNIKFTDDGIAKIAEIATTVNQNVENIGARRLHTMLEKLLEEISFKAGDDEHLSNQPILVDEAYVINHLENITTKMDLSKFIL
ncbi:ATP-dependent protease ATPase subunit HslU [Rickettsiales endosymbiont of Stachyamoeba lipophora]|uniref:ATP-dependent protease ATPase subunit HslU n=1 Tax=Rickettsiales endosymbiont of Stachyamoeba lipophora TaxID=2486578 RepID=UPI000F65593D|nr:ATP-dependent protease ATPase subunit HslU [Rickettsiales endosymbiont of Stachyamoeba lipophora]AZL15089.1 ATP-dependent protease ATPase subunit HslU [Rickettsiales endosymbiont of Stachyamoeba lipophora]